MPCARQRWSPKQSTSSHGCAPKHLSCATAGEIVKNSLRKERPGRSGGHEECKVGIPLLFFTRLPLQGEGLPHIVQMGCSKMPDGEQTGLHRALVLDEPEKVLGFPQCRDQTGQHDKQGELCLPPHAPDLKV